MNLPAWTRTALPLIAGAILALLVSRIPLIAALLNQLLALGITHVEIVAALAAILGFAYHAVAVWLGKRWPWMETVLLVSTLRPNYRLHSRGYGWTPDVADDRDHVLALETVATQLPAAFSLRSEMPPVYNQGQLGACTAHGAAAAFDYDRKVQGLSFEFPARLFIYYWTRFLEGTVGTDSGGQVRDAIKVLKSYGAPPEKLWKYVISKFTIRPSDASILAAKSNEALDYSRVPATVAAIKTVLAVKKRPVVFGFVVFPELESAAVAKTGILPMPNGNERSIGGHCVDVIGYALIDGKPYWEIRNSWGKSWGDHGHFWMPEAYLLDSTLSSDRWVVETVAA